MGSISISVGNSIRKQTIKNLLKAQEQIAEKGNAKENIRIAKFLFKTAEEFDDDIQQFSFEENEEAGD